ncbi:MAG: hypothetical protein HW401_24, partial [Parcubacteria group bacterium]|nr:hypothetical protein [Parcubacteria group bacterium]
KFDDPLCSKIFAYTTALFLLMSYIAEIETGKTLKEQIEYEKQRSSS